MVVFLKKTLLTVTLAIISVWLIRYGILHRVAASQNYEFEKSEAELFKRFADVSYDFGLHAWYSNIPDMAADYFRRALLTNRLQMDAWIKLAETELARGNPDQAAQILIFSHHLTKEVVKWKWQQILVARELNLEDVFIDNINFMISHRQYRDEALYLLDNYLNSDTCKVLKVLELQNVPDYLYWLMKWRRTEDSIHAWEELFPLKMVDDRLYKRYVNFLISQKEIQRAAATRKQHTGEEGITNPGFESPISNQAFGWRVRPEQYLDIQRVKSEKMEGSYSLQVMFSGRENINLLHLSQFVPVLPGKSHIVSFWWRSNNLTTDQRPFIEIIGYDCRKSYWKSEMVPPSTDWQQQIIFFTLPEDCNAVRIRLRRNKSHRFDNKINGVLWLDNFILDTLFP